MKRLNVIITLTLLLLVPQLAMSVTNPKWITQISSTHPFMTLEEGWQPTFSAKFKVKKGPVSNLRVVVRLDNHKIWEKVYPQLNQDAVETVKVNWTATQGDHIIKFRIDPHSTSGDIDPSNESNLLKKQFAVGPRGMNTVMMATAKTPDLELTMYSLPRSPQVGDTVDVTGHVKNIGSADSKACNLRFKSGTHYYPETYPVPLIKPGRHFEITIQKKMTRATTYTMGAELWGCVELHQNNNKASLDITPRAPDLIISKWEARGLKVGLRQPVKVRVWVKNVGNADSGPFEIDAFFEPCKGIAQGRRWASVDSLKTGEEVMREISHKFGCIGIKHLDKIVVDNDNKVIESNEQNNVEFCFRIFEVGIPWH